MPLLWIGLAFIAGIVLAAHVGLPHAAWLGLAGCALLLAIFSRFLRFRLTRSPSAVHPFTQRFALAISSLPNIPYSLLPLCIFLGAARYQALQPDLASPSYVAYYNDLPSQVWVSGRLAKPPEFGDRYVDLKLQTEWIQLQEEGIEIPVNGLVAVRVWEGHGESLAETWRYGDRLLLVGALVTPPEEGDFSIRRYLAHQGVYSQLEEARILSISPGRGNPVLRLVHAYRAHALDAVYRLWPDPEASLFAGILLGAESGIPEAVYKAFRDTGTAHVIVISGFNITVLAGLLVGVFRRVLGRGQFGVRRATVIALAGIFLYAVLVGGEAAVVRAAVMGVLGLFARQLGRRQVGVNTLTVVAAGMVFFNPRLPWDVSFQLSFAATLGLVLYAAPLQEAFMRFTSRYLPLEAAQRLSQPVGEYLLFTLAAQVLILPISLYYFQKLSPISVVANPLVLPAQPPLMVLGGFALLLGTIYLPLGQVPAWLAWPFAAYTIRVAELLARVPGGSISTGYVGLVAVIAFYVGVFALTFAVARVKGLASRVAPGLGLAGLFALTVLFWRVALAAPDGRLHLTVLDVGSGDGLLIQTPTGRAVLVDGGPSAVQLSEQLGRRLPFGRRQLDWLVVGAAGEENIGGLPRVLERFPPANVLWAGPVNGTAAGRELGEALAEAGIQPVDAQAGQVLDLGEGAFLRVLAAGRLGAVLLLEWDRFRVVLPLGMDFDSLEMLQGEPSLAQVSALLLTDCGYAPLNPPGWIEKLRPQAVLLSVGAGDRQGLPSPETLEAVAGYSLLRTDQNGWIEISTDGERMWVEVERK